MKRILFVDDESKVLDGIRRMLYHDRNRWEMEFAVGAEAALKKCEERSFDVVVSDMRMPGMDGAAFLGKICDLYPSAARIILSGYSDVEVSARAVSVAHRFLNKPCTAAELQSTLERVCTLQDIMCSAEIRNIVSAVGELPSLSTTFTSLTRAVQDPDISMAKVAEIIEQDMAMSAKVLQLVNSAFFGLARRVTNLRDAVSYLGIETIRNLALASETFRVFTPDSRIPQSICEEMQSNAHRTAAIASILPVDPKLRDMTVVAALLHDIGRLVLASRMPDTFRAVLVRARERKCDCFVAEEELLGTSHAEIGAYLLGLWGIPNPVIEVIAHHHHPTRIPHSGFDSLTAVYVADLLADEIRDHPQDATGSELDETDRACLETLGISDRFVEFRELALRSHH
jgi:HD-like signal output (HDOD) protein/CheY-like chemotaxis protein